MSLGRAVSREILVYALGTFVGGGIQYLAVPIYTRIFAPEEYSRLVLVQTLVGLIAGVVAVGGDTTLARFWFTGDVDASERDWRSRLTVTWVGFLLTLSFAVTLLLLPLSGVLAEWSFGGTGDAKLYLAGLLYLVPAQTSRMLAQVLRNEFRAVAFAATAMVLGTLTLLLGLVFALWLEQGVFGILLGSVAAEVLVLSVRLVLIRARIVARPDPRLLAPLLRFGAPLIPVSLSFWVFTTSDRLVVAKLASLEDLGRYSVASTLTTGFGVLIMAVGQAWTPRAVQLSTTDPLSAAVALGRALTYFLFVLSLVAVVVAAAAPWIVAVVSGPAYAPAATAVPLLVAGVVAYGSSILTGTGVLVARRTGRLPFIASTAAVINLVLAVTLVPAFGIVGAAAATAVGYLLLTCGYLWLAQRFWPVVLESRRLLVIVGALVATTAISTWLGTDRSPVRLLLPVAFLAVVLPVARITSADRSFVVGMLTRRSRS